MTLVKYWADIEHMPDSKQVYLAADVDALLDDPQALAAYLVERRKGKL